MVWIQHGWSLKENACRKDSWGKCSKILYCFHEICRNIRTSGTERPLELETETSSVSFTKSSLSPSRISKLGQATGSAGWCHCKAPLNHDWEGWGETENWANIIPVFRTGQKHKPMTNPNLSPSFWFLGKSGSMSSWSIFLSAWRQFYLGTVSIDVSSVDLAWSARLPSMIKWLDMWTRGEQWMSFILILVRLSTVLHSIFCIQAKTLWSEWVENWLGKKPVWVIGLSS